MTEEQIRHMTAEEYLIEKMSECISRPILKFCRACEEEVKHGGWKLCPECKKRKREYEEKYHCIVDVGIKGIPGKAGNMAHPRNRISILKERYKNKRSDAGGKRIDRTSENVAYDGKILET